MGKRQSGGRPASPPPPPYRIELTAGAREQFLGLPQGARERVRAAVDSLADSPRPVGCKKLQATSGYRIRVGDWRLLYTVDDSARLVTVFRMADRKDACRGL